jgi:hypothetical protein
MGNREFRQTLTARRRFAGQDSGGPRGVEAQSNERIRRAISLSPGKMLDRSAIVQPYVLHLLRVVMKGTNADRDSER